MLTRYLVIGPLLTTALAAQTLIYNNGPFLTGTVSGTQVSVLQNVAPITHTTFGYGAQQAATATARNSVLDNFTVNSALVINQVEVFGYTTGATAVSATGVYLAIWDSDPALGTPNQLILPLPTAAGPFDTTNNRISTAVNTFTNVFRTLPGTPGTTRNIQSVLVTIPQIVLGPGTYWLEFAFNGINFVPPITATNVLSTGDASQFLNTTLAYAPINNGVGRTAGLPFCFYGPGAANPGSITNLGGSCSTATMTLVGAPAVGGFLRAELANVNPLTVGAVIIGFSDPNAPLFVCSCTSRASLDVLNIANDFSLDIPLVAGLVGFELFAQGAEIDLLGGSGQPCNLGVAFGLTDGFRFRLNSN
jgi:hypothetical protein